jgi:2-polyprenyl-3-methyl-5-hydroxy-6-metoxy-1,4-benzoquinol methylase
MSLITRFMSVNRRLCGVIEKRLPADFNLHLLTLHKQRVAGLVNARRGCVALDVGAGRECAFLPLIKDRGANLIIAMDISEAELRCNRQAMAMIVADAAAPGLLLRGNSVDIIASHSVIEHLRDNARFFANCARVLRPGGTLIHTFPCKFAPYALINQLLPNWLTRRLLAYFQPHWQQETVGFPAFYDRCSFSQIENLLHRNDLEIKKYIFLYYQSIYFDFFLPIYLAMLAYDLIIWRLRIRNLACGMVMIAEKKPFQLSFHASGDQPALSVPSLDSDTNGGGGQSQRGTPSR